MSTRESMKKQTLWLTVTALFTAMNILLSMSIFSIPVPGGHLYINDIVIVFAALVLDPFAAFIVGGVGAFLGDMLFYPAPMFVSLVAHGLQAVLIALIARHVLKKHPAVSSTVAVTVGGIVEIVGYTIGRTFFYGKKSWEVALQKLPFQFLQVAIGAAAAIVLCHTFGLNKVFKKMLGDRIYKK